MVSLAMLTKRKSGSKAKGGKAFESSQMALEKNIFDETGLCDIMWYLVVSFGIF